VASSAWVQVGLSGECRDVLAAFEDIESWVDEVDDVVLRFKLAPELRRPLLASDQRVLRSVAADSGVRVFVPELGDAEGIVTMEGVIHDVCSLFERLWTELYRIGNGKCSGEVVFPVSRMGHMIGRKGAHCVEVRQQTGITTMDVRDRPMRWEDLPVYDPASLEGAMLTLVRGCVGMPEEEAEGARAALTALGMAPGGSRGVSSEGVVRPKVGRASLRAQHRWNLKLATLVVEGLGRDMFPTDAFVFARRTARAEGFPVPCPRGEAGMWLRTMEAAGHLSAEAIAAAASSWAAAAASSLPHHSKQRERKPSISSSSDAASSWRVGDRHHHTKKERGGDDASSNHHHTKKERGGDDASGSSPKKSKHHQRKPKPAKYE
jgi:hypothetical protein